jgi:hypothetical protein
MTRWGQIEGIDGNLYWGRYFTVFENSDLADNEGNFKKHLLLEFLDYLKVVQYVRDTDQVFEIIIKARV